MLKVISGEVRGRYLRSPRGLKTRPTASRVRESIFSRLGARIDFTQCRVLDLFAGSGSLGIEALSRGAQYAVFVDSSRAAAQCIMENLATLGFLTRARVERADIGRALRRLERLSERFHLVFIDPPYGKGLAEKALRALVDLELLEDGAWLVAETSTRENVSDLVQLQRVNETVIGDHRLLWYRFWRGQEIR